MALVERSKFGLNELLGATVQHHVIASKSRLQDEVAPSGCSRKYTCYCSFQGTEPRLFLTDRNSFPGPNANSKIASSVVSRSSLYAEISKTSDQAILTLPTEKPAP